MTLIAGILLGIGVSLLRGRSEKRDLSVEATRYWALSPDREIRRHNRTR